MKARGALPAAPAEGGFLRTSAAGIGLNALPRGLRALVVAGAAAIVCVLAVHLVAIGRQRPWWDEIYVNSTGLSIARSQPPIPSVLAQYPGTDSPIRFYGPVSFEASALLIRLFGISPVLWRYLCVSGLALTLAAAVALLRLAGADPAGQVLGALLLALGGSIADLQRYGRWDFVTSGLFLCGLYLCLRAVVADGRGLGWRAAAGGAFLGLALGSTPRALTLSAAAAVSFLAAGAVFTGLRRRLSLAALIAFFAASSTHALLLLPWGLTPWSWYAYVRKAASLDKGNLTSALGEGGWGLGLGIHKASYLVLLSLLVLGAAGALSRRGRYSRAGREDFVRFVLTAFGVVNLCLMMVVVSQALGQPAFWLPGIVLAAACWFEWRLIGASRPAVAATIFAAGLSLLILSAQQAQQVAAILLSWQQRSSSRLDAFVQKSIPRKVAVYGVTDGYFYAVEGAGDQYLIYWEQARDGLASEPDASIAQKVEQRLCAGPAFVIWPKPISLDPSAKWSMPAALRDRLQPAIGELVQPPIPAWKWSLLLRLGPVAGKFGFPDAVLYPLRSLNPPHSCPGS